MANSSGHSKFAVFALFDDTTTRCIRMLQEQLATRTKNSVSLFFPVHTTIRGRFWASSNEAFNAFRGLCQHISSSPIAVKLTGPVFLDPDLIWFEVNANAMGFKELCALHYAAIDHFRNTIMKDETPIAQTGEGFRPHVTLGWGCTKKDAQVTIESFSPVMLSAKMKSVALARYPEKWPVSEKLDLVEIVELS